MCGIAGILTAPGAGARELERRGRRMADALSHRGPDDSGCWTDGEAGVCLAHRRLSIVDLTPDGHQPMRSPDGRWMVSFNGEIYNFHSLRDELAGLGHAFRTQSDTEVMLVAFQEWGVLESLPRLGGMFAFAAWDGKEGRLWLARDRLGKKPLYHGWRDRELLFASETKALAAVAGAVGVDREAVGHLLRVGYIPQPLSIHPWVRQLPPASWACWRPGEQRPESEGRYWDLREVARRGIAARTPLSWPTALDGLDRVVRQAVAERMVADVPLGAFLSGGIDSSAVVALMQAQSTVPVRTFTVGFFEEGYDEAAHAARVAAHLGTAHTELYVTPEEALKVIPRLATMYDEPFADPSQIPTFLVSQLARRHVTVALSGDGGDEVFGGYRRYAMAQHLWGRVGWMPPAMRHSLARAVLAVRPSAWDRLGRSLNWASRGRVGLAQLGDKVQKGASLLSCSSPLDLYHALTTHWRESIALGAQVDSRAEPLGVGTLLDEMMAEDTTTYLPDDILVKVDRASMAVSLEVRAPLLDHRVVEYAWGLPPGMKVHGRQGKWILRQLLHRHVPKELVERPKMGFGVPIGDWLRGPLRDWAGTLLDPMRLRQEGFLDPEPVQRKWAEHQSGRRNWQYLLWDVLMFQLWLEQRGPEGRR